MSLKSDHNAENLEKYLTEQLSDAEMHRLEAESLDDEFLSDALEGLAMVNENDRKTDLAQIQAKLYQKTTSKRRKKIIFTPQKQRWAASVVLLISCSIIFVLYQINFFDSGIAESTKQIENLSHSVPQIEGRFSEADEYLFEEEESSLEASEMMEKEALEEIKLAERFMENEVSEKTTQQQKKAGKKVEKISAEQRMLSVNKDRQNSNQNTDFEFNDEPAGNVPSPSPEPADRQSNEVNKEIKSELRRQEDKAGITESNRIKKDAILEGEIADSEEEFTNEEVQMSGGITNSKKVKKASISFDDFLKKNLIYPEEAKKSNISGLVKVQFWIKKNGKITDLKILQKLGYGCDEEAIRLIQNYPHWQADSQDGRKVRILKTLEIRFPLP